MDAWMDGCLTLYCRIHLGKIWTKLFMFPDKYNSLKAYPQKVCQFYFVLLYSFKLCLLA